ncbi:movement protein [Sesamum angolense]|uniref:Movement protein n=1 Tax=Sesamum angolense TaxID=2727404 RepID=A0AAE1XH39_9LAMI|nr:movement protein [Sesamum angolense]
MTVSNKTMERIMRQDSNLSPYDGFRIGGSGKVLNQIGLNQRKHHIIYKISSGKLMFDIHPRIAYNLADQDFSRVLTLHQDFKRKDLMKEGNKPYSITYTIAYALSNTHNSDLFIRKEYIEIPEIFKEFAKVMAPDPIRIPRIGGVDIVIKDHLVLDRTISSRTEFSSRMPFSEDRIMGYKGKEKDLLKALTPQEIRDSEFAQQNLEFSLKKQGKPYCYCRKGFFTKILIFNTGIREAKIMIGGAFGTPWFRGKTPPIYFHDTSADILLGFGREKAFNRIMPINFRSKRGDFDAKLTHPKMQDKRKFDKVLLSFRQQGLIDSDSFYEDELVVYTDANDYRWAAVLMKKTTTGEEPYRYTGGLFTKQQAQVWHINEKEFFAIWKAFKKCPLFLLAKEFTLKVDNTNVKAFLKNKLESKIEKARIIK